MIDLFFLSFVRLSFPNKRAYELNWFRIDLCLSLSLHWIGAWPESRWILNLNMELFGWQKVYCTHPNIQFHRADRIIPKHFRFLHNLYTQPPESEPKQHAWSPRNDLHVIQIHHISFFKTHTHTQILHFLSFINIILYYYILFLLRKTTF